MVEWHHQLNGLEFEQTPGDGEGQGSLASCSPWGHRVRHDWATEQQNELTGVTHTYSIRVPTIVQGRHWPSQLLWKRQERTGRKGRPHLYVCTLAAPTPCFLWVEGGQTFLTNWKFYFFKVVDGDVEIMMLQMVGRDRLMINDHIPMSLFYKTLSWPLSHLSPSRQKLYQF